jgi:ADP-ribose pyrophosphatase YjhB (NUDIX family)
MNHCSQCGGPITERIPPDDDRSRFVCDRCGTIHYQNPRVVVGTIPEDGGRILLCRRAIEPRLGLWTLPAGFLEMGEQLSDGAMRETWEETGCRVELLGLYSIMNLVHVGQVHLFYRARLLDIHLEPTRESLEVALFDPDQLPWNELAFTSVVRTLRRWIQDRPFGRFPMFEDLVPPVARW